MPFPCHSHPTRMPFSCHERTSWARKKPWRDCSTRAAAFALCLVLALRRLLQKHIFDNKQLRTKMHHLTGEGLNGRFNGLVVRRNAHRCPDPLAWIDMIFFGHLIHFTLAHHACPERSFFR